MRHDRGVGRRLGRHQHSDRSKSKHSIPGCEPWVLVKTKLGRRFVYNVEQNTSLWKFPPDVLKGVVEYDRQEREKRQKTEHDSPASIADGTLPAPAEKDESKTSAPTADRRPSMLEQSATENGLASDEEYEEVEFTDDEEDGREGSEKEHAVLDKPIEFDEDDMEYQLAAMGQDYGLDHGEFGNVNGDDLEDGAAGLPLTEEDMKALFKDMLNDYQINPYTPWDTLVDAGHILEDDRYTVLSSMRARRETWSDWSKDRIRHLKEQREQEEKKDPKIPYFAFLAARATPKLYWPEFRRKYQKEPEMRNTKLTDKDREKWYREYINRKSFMRSEVQQH